MDQNRKDCGKEDEQERVASFGVREEAVQGRNPDGVTLESYRVSVPIRKGVGHQ
jgi:hypothetical protein